MSWLGRDPLTRLRRKSLVLLGVALLGYLLAGLAMWQGWL